MKGFFHASTLKVVKSPTSIIPQCGVCQLFKGCKSPKMQPTGSGRKGILIVGEAPGRHEDAQGRQFVGDSGRVLRRALVKAGVDPDKDCVFTNALICRPKDNKISDERMVDYCRPNLLNTIEEYNPTTIILLGGRAVNSLLTHLWKEDVGGISRWAGFRIPCRNPNAWICPTYHPSFVMRDKRDKDLYEMVFQNHIKAAVNYSERPWDEIPDYESECEPVFESSRAAGIIRKMIEKGGECAFDYETTTLKPDGPKARIVSCSVCWQGKKTIAYPWYGEAVEATKELLLSPLGKIASNAKFEERWTRKHLGISVRNWKWDTMQMAHVLDCRPGITSIKFQAFIHLGQVVYDAHVQPYLKSEGKRGNEENRIKEIDLTQLLIYNAMDSLLEYRVTQIQKKVFGVK